VSGGRVEERVGEILVERAVRRQQRRDDGQQEETSNDASAEPRRRPRSRRAVLFDQGAGSRVAIGFPSSVGIRGSSQA